MVKEIGFEANSMNGVFYSEPEKEFYFKRNKKKTYSAAWEKDIPANDGDNVSVYISHPVPENTYLDYEVETRKYFILLKLTL